MNKLDAIAMEHIAGEIAIDAMTEEDARTRNATVGFKVVATDAEGWWVTLSECHTVPQDVLEKAIAMGYRWQTGNYTEEKS